MEKYSYVYILASKRNGTLYIGATTDLQKRVWEHKHTSISKFTHQYKVFKLVYYETYDELEFAFTRERQIKKWKRAWKIELIEKLNPYWRDLYRDIY